MICVYVYVIDGLCICLCNFMNTYLSDVWKKDKKKALKSKEAKKAFVQGRLSLPIVSEDAGNT